MSTQTSATTADNMTLSMGHAVNQLCQPVIKATRAPSKRQHLALSDVRQAVNAAEYAKHIGKPLNRMITLWSKHSRGFSSEPRAWIAHQGRYIKALLAWLHHRGVSAPYLAIREYGDVKLAHSHILCHVPTHLAESFNEFAVQAGNFEDCPAGSDNRPVVMSGGWPWEETGAETPAQRAGLLRYCLKDISPTARVGGVLIAASLGIDPEHNTKLIEGKRISVHRGIGQAARQEAGWRELSTLAELRAALPTGEDARRERRRKAQPVRRDAGHV
jgi:hypothetical protein